MLEWSLWREIISQLNFLAFPYKEHLRICFRIYCQTAENPDEEGYGAQGTGPHTVVARRPPGRLPSRDTLASAQTNHVTIPGAGCSLWN